MTSSPPIALVFGASGQIGMPLLQRLRVAGWQVLALSRQRQAQTEDVRWLRGSFDQMPALPAQVAAVFGCGPLDHFAQWYADARLCSPRVIAFGSTSVHVKQASVDAAERDVAQRLRQAELQLFASAAARGEAVTVLRPTLVYGAARDATLTRIASLARRHGRFVLPATAVGRRQPVHVDDLAAAALAAAAARASHGHGYDLPGGETLAYCEMVQRVLGCLSPPPRLHRLPLPVFRALRVLARMRGIAGDLSDAAIARMGEDLVFDAEPARRDFGYSPRPFVPQAAMFTAR
ncbi:MAG: nucleoside-diphosphate sugar epimerase [Xanthomonadaceae bacterium]|nr:nucleoside-diphosphate sugar epimerase [Xanthomonadaceae bacterium]